MTYFFAKAGKPHHLPLFHHLLLCLATISTSSPATAQECLQQQAALELPSDLQPSRDWPFELVSQSKPGQKYRLSGLLFEPLPDHELKTRQSQLIKGALSSAPQDLAFFSAIKPGTKPKTDRYGRQVIILTTKTTSSSPENWQQLQTRLLEAGLARFDPETTNHPCSTIWLAAEKVARSKKAGLWAHSHFAVRPVTDVHLPAMISTYQIIHGKVLSVSRRPQGTSYLNFGHHWKSDFTVKLSKKALTVWEQQNKSLDDLLGTSIYVRGWIESHNGPLIRVANPLQLEIDVGDATSDEQSLEP